MSKKTDYDALAERLTDPEVPLKASRSALTGDAASQVGREFLLGEYGSERAIEAAMRRGRPKVGQSRGESPAVRGRLSQDDYVAFKRLEKATGRTQSDLVREAVHNLLDDHKMVG